MYTHENFKSKAALVAAVKAGKAVTYYQPGPFGGNEPLDGVVYIEGPHYPAPHRFYVVCEVKGGVIVKVKK